MRHIREWLDRAIGAFYQRRRDDDLEQELAAHVARRKRRPSGKATPPAAHTAPPASDRAGPPRRRKSTSRSTRTDMDSRPVLRHRVWLTAAEQTPDASGAAILSLGQAIGATTAFSTHRRSTAAPAPAGSRSRKPCSYVAFTIHDSQNRPTNSTTSTTPPIRSTRRSSAPVPT